jgi:hypothetical protein
MVKAFQNFDKGFGTCNGKMVFSTVIQFLPLGYRCSLKILHFSLRLDLNLNDSWHAFIQLKKFKLLLIVYTCKNVRQLFSSE